MMGGTNMKILKNCGIGLLIFASFIASPLSNIIVNAEQEISGGSQNEILIGNNCDSNVINAGAGNDIVLGGSGNDIINGGTGNDILFGDDGDDHLIGGTGYDILVGDTGNDTAHYNLNSNNYTIQIGSNSQEDLRLRVINENELDNLVNVENLNFNDTQINDIEYIPVNAYLHHLLRNSNGTYTAIWGYENANEYEAFNDQNYFEDEDSIIENNYMIFQRGNYAYSIYTIVDGLEQRWVLGNQFILADTRPVEAEYQYQKYLNRQALRERLVKESLKNMQSLIEKGILQQNVFTLESIDAFTPFEEFVSLLTRITGTAPANIPDVPKNNDGMLTKEQLTVLLLTALNVQPVINPESKFTDDSSITVSAKGYAYAARQAGIITESNNLYFNPQSLIPRYEVYRILSQYLKLMK
jgi:hypothetical protein